MYKYNLFYYKILFNLKNTRYFVYLPMKKKIQVPIN